MASYNTLFCVGLCRGGIKGCANLDTTTSRQILELFRNLNRDLGQTIVMVSHEPWHTEYFDRVITLQDGEIIAG